MRRFRFSAACRWLALVALGCLVCGLQGCAVLSPFGPPADNIGRTHVAIEKVERVGKLNGVPVLVLAAGIYRQQVGISFRLHDMICYPCEKTGAPAEIWLLKMEEAPTGGLRVCPPGIPWFASGDDMALLEACPCPPPSLGEIRQAMAPCKSLQMEGWHPQSPFEPLFFVETRNTWVHYAAMPLAALGTAVDCTATIGIYAVMIPMLPVLWAVQGIRRMGTGKDE